MFFVGFAHKKHPKLHCFGRVVLFYVKPEEAAEFTPHQ